MGPEKAMGGWAAAEAYEKGVEYRDTMKVPSATYLRDVGISLKTLCPGWQEAHSHVYFWVIFNLIRIILTVCFV